MPARIYLGRPTVAGEGGTGKLGKVPAAASIGVALTTTAIIAVALGVRLLAAQACRHRPPNLPAPHNFADSHQGLEQRRPCEPAEVIPFPTGRVERRDRLGGVLHEYFRAA